MLFVVCLFMLGHDMFKAMFKAVFKAVFAHTASVMALNMSHV